MKKILLFFPFVLCACIQQQGTQSLSASSDSMNDEHCADIQEYKIFQVIEDGSLASACEADYDDEICNGLVVYIPKKEGQIYYDEMIIESDYNQCITYEGTYRYLTKNDSIKTVPKIKFVDF